MPGLPRAGPGDPASSTGCRPCRRADVGSTSAHTRSLPSAAAGGRAATRRSRTRARPGCLAAGPARAKVAGVHGSPSAAGSPLVDLELDEVVEVMHERPALALGELRDIAGVPRHGGQLELSRPARRGTEHHDLNRAGSATGVAPSKLGAPFQCLMQIYAFPNAERAAFLAAAAKSRPAHGADAAGSARPASGVAARGGMLGARVDHGGHRWASSRVSRRVGRS